ncbi:MAG: thermonuclease family protein [Elstera sp.]
MAAPAILAGLVALGLSLSAQAAVSPETVNGFPEIAGAGTIRLGVETIRLHGIATAVVGSPVEIEARGWLHRRINARRVYCHFDPTADLVNGARNGMCEIEGLDLSALLVEAGMAVDCPATSKGRYKIQQQRAEAAGFTMAERIPLPSSCGGAAKKSVKKRS